MADEAISQHARQRVDARGDSRLDWLRSVRFGMFIHWGLYALPAGSWKGQPIEGIGEWIMKRARIPVAEYEQLAERFDPVDFDAEAWADLAVAAGQKYVVITAKHHDGFCLFDSEVSDYDIVDATPFGRRGRDPIAELATACEARGLRLCFYYSQTQDWHHPGGRGNDWDFDEETKDFDGYLRTYVEPQLTELLTNYGPIGLIWFDTPKDITVEQSRRLVDLVHELQPDCLVNGRIGNGLGDYAQAGDNRIPATAVGGEWEVPATLNDTWGFKADDENWKSVEVLVGKLVDIVSKGGNYLLNVGPTATGVIPEPSAERLRAVGEWLAVNGRAVYDTMPGPIQGVDGVRSTVPADDPYASDPNSTADTVYLHVLDWPSDGIVRVPAAGLPGDGATGARLLADDRDVPVRRDGTDLVLEVAGVVPDPSATVLVLRAH